MLLLKVCLILFTTFLTLYAAKKGSFPVAVLCTCHTLALIVMLRHFN